MNHKKILRIIVILAHMNIAYVHAMDTKITIHCSDGKDIKDVPQHIAHLCERLKAQESSEQAHKHIKSPLSSSDTALIIERLTTTIDQESAAKIIKKELIERLSSHSFDMLKKTIQLAHAAHALGCGPVQKASRLALAYYLSSHDTYQYFEKHENHYQRVLNAVDDIEASIASHISEEIVRNNVQGYEPHTLHADTRNSGLLALNSDGTLLAVEEESLKIMDPESGKVKAVLTGQTDKVLSLAFSRDGYRLAAGLEDHSIRIWNMAGKPSCIRTIPTNEIVWSVAYHPDGALLASADSNEIVHLWDSHSGEYQGSLQYHDRDLDTPIVFSPDGKHIASCARDKTIKLWNPYTRELSRSLEGHETPVCSVAFSPDGKRLASIDYHTIKVWNMSIEKKQACIQTHVSLMTPRTISFTADGSKIVSAFFAFGRCGQIAMWDFKSGSITYPKYHHNLAVQSLAFDSKGSYATASIFSSGITVCKLKRGQFARHFTLSQLMSYVRLKKHNKSSGLNKREIYADLLETLKKAYPKDIQEYTDSVEHILCKGRSPFK